jgi:MYXO-CTERM domain-containing protein
MPAAARVEDFSSGSSKPAVVSDSTAQITEGLRSYNAAHGVGADPGGCGCHVPGTGSRGARGDAMLSAAAALGVLARRRRRKSA